MTSALGQHVYIKNKPGTAGAVGAEDVAKAAPDGYSLFLTTSGAVAIAPHVAPIAPGRPWRASGESIGMM
ncbi:tripartite tricarboxylate transporter substrate-binding protein [Bradyrhizobium sp.]|uniref:tripartite tricarboxylate transporter substrate-binding protein n=1 Tax=Bradyrhizobium sp. TaxID=376 RepID=UPI003C6F7106